MTEDMTNLGPKTVSYRTPARICLGGKSSSIFFKFDHPTRQLEVEK